MSYINQNLEVSPKSAYTYIKVCSKIERKKDKNKWSEKKNNVPKNMAAQDASEVQSSPTYKYKPACT